jgi:hypothetical protein
MSSVASMAHRAGCTSRNCRPRRSALGAQSASLLKFDLRPASALQIVDDDG